jgi:uncharacterized membrane protein
MIARGDERQDRVHVLNRRVGLILRVMTAVSLLLIVAGMLMYLTTGTPRTVDLMPFATLINGMLTFSPTTLVTAGLIVTLITPLTVLLVSFAHYIATRDRKPIIVCLVLLAMMAASYILVLKMN